MKILNVTYLLQQSVANDDFKQFLGKFTKHVTP